MSDGKKLFNEKLNWLDGTFDKLAIADGNLLVGAQSNPDENGVKTILTIGASVKPDGLMIGDMEPDVGVVRYDGHAIHFCKPSSVQVFIDALEEIKADMLKATGV